MNWDLRCAFIRITPPPEPGAAGGGTGNKGKVANHQDTLAVNHAPLRPNDYYPCLCARPGMPGRIQICRVGSRTSRFPLIGRNESKKMNDQTCKKIFARQYFRERQASIFAISVVIPHSLPRLGQYRAVSTPFLESRALAYWAVMRVIIWQYTYLLMCAFHKECLLFSPIRATSWPC